MELEFAVDSLRAAHWLAPLELDGEPRFAAGTFQQAQRGGGSTWKKVYDAEDFLLALEDAFAGRRRLYGAASLHLTACAGVKDVIRERVMLRFDMDMRPHKATIIVDEATPPDRRQALYDRLARDVGTIPGVKPFA